ncbi:hypothetical protein GWI33_011339, partial [Rhynchophorus ferrugineus]
MTSIISTASRSAAHDLLITGDTDGYLRLFRYPCLNPKGEYNEEKVYSGTVACARFLFNDRNIVTVVLQHRPSVYLPVIANPRARRWRERFYQEELEDDREIDSEIDSTTFE